MSESLVATPALFPISEQRPKSTTSFLPSNVKRQVQKFWQNSPCDSWFTNEPCRTSAFYRELDAHRYKVHRRLQSAVGFEKTRGLRVLEIGCGCGSEAERFARYGAHYTPVDLTNAAVSITQERFRLARLNGRFVQGDAENLPFADASFDLVYSHGVLHHTPDTPRTIREVHRVLAPGGRAVIMLYYRDSFNYHVNLGIVRRARAHMLRTNWASRSLGQYGASRRRNCGGTPTWSAPTPPRTSKCRICSTAIPMGPIIRFHKPSQRHRRRGCSSNSKMSRPR